MLVGVSVTVAAGDSKGINASRVGEGVAVKDGDSLNTIAFADVGVSGTKTSGADVFVGGTYPTGVGVRY